MKATRKEGGGAIFLHPPPPHSLLLPPPCFPSYRNNNITRTHFDLFLTFFHFRPALEEIFDFFFRSNHHHSSTKNLGRTDIQQ